MERPEEQAYLRTVAELQELATKAPHVTHEWVLKVASMDTMDMRRRLIRSYDWHEHFARSLDGIDAIRNMPGGGIDGCRSHKEVRAIVLALIDRLEEQDARIEALEKALRFYAQRKHFALSDADAWDTVSGEPQNYWCDDAGTATVEDGTIARAALAASEPRNGEQR